MITPCQHTIQNESKEYTNYMELNGRLPMAVVEALLPVYSFSKVEGRSIGSIQYS
jgi:hypothetical protein